ncbi:MAG: excinuclease ABC subunit UvrA [Alphaproteobacteria bacterium]|nr:excinuclease ABC subunit UvrA [Alphaproteobacteria bacterium]
MRAPTPDETTALKAIRVRGAREHNLKNIDVEIPRDRLVVITGLSGSGMSSLAFDTIYAEGQRRYVESLSAYARQFLELMQKPDVDSIEGLSPAISIEQKTTSRNPRSTVGTVTEIYDYMRLLFARVGVPTSPATGLPIESQTVSQMADRILAMPEGTKLMLLAPIVRGRKGEYRKELQELRKKGFQRVKIDGEVYDIEDAPALNKKIKHDIAVVVDRIIVKPDLGNRLADSVETALKLADGLLFAENMANGKTTTFSSKFACPVSGFTIDEIEPRLFSFNNPHGACPACDGLGDKLYFDPELVIPDESLSIAAGAIAPWKTVTSMFYTQTLETLARHFKASLKKPWRELDEKFRHAVLYGTGEKALSFHYESSSHSFHSRKPFEGVIPNMERRWRETESAWIREEFSRYQSSQPCEVCHGQRLKPEALAVKIAGKNISEVTALSIKAAAAWFRNLSDDSSGQRGKIPPPSRGRSGGGENSLAETSGFDLQLSPRSRSPLPNPPLKGEGTPLLTPKQLEIAKRILKEINERLGFLNDVGLEYLTLARASGTLSGGESQRIRLASQIGSGLTGVLYVLDEPSIGLHQRDNQRLLATLKNLRDLGNTVVVVEHDEEAIRTADYLIDMGPGAGVNGGAVVAAGTPEAVMKSKDSITAAYLTGRRTIPFPAHRRSAKKGQWLEVVGAHENNLKNIRARFPLGCFICVTGVSGGGKSTLVIETLYKALARQLNNSRDIPGTHESLKGAELIDKIVDINQAPIGRTPRSNPATYTGAFTPIREWYAGLPESRARGYKAGRFSFNVKGGRCEACEGDGVIRIEMHFLPDVFVTCDACHGRRYNRETLEVVYRDKSIADVLDMTVCEGAEFFAAVPQVRDKMETLKRVGLGYVKIGQSATTLSGGEAQRVKLAKELSRRATGKTLYILDEPTTGLHFEDVKKLLEVLQALVDQGNTVIVIEHNLEVIKTADHIIDLGPEGGDGGGKIIASGTPEDVAKIAESYTGRYLVRVLEKS